MGAGRSDARAANVPRTRAAWRNADEGGERKAARVRGSFAALAGCAPHPPRLLWNDDLFKVEYNINPSP